METFAINALCTAYRTSPQLAYKLAEIGAKFASPVPAIDIQTSPLKTLLLGVGLLAIADVSTSTRKLISSGNAQYADAWTICAGLHKDHDAPQLSNGEYPACAAMTSGYVFRVENEATVHYLQRVGRTGQLTTVSVKSSAKSSQSMRLRAVVTAIIQLITISTLARLLWLGDRIAMLALLVYVVVRWINSAVTSLRAVQGWKGRKEPGVVSDILVLLSQDRWIRLQGMTDDMKATLSGEWLRQPTFSQRLAMTASTMLAYLNVAVVAGASTEGQIALLVLLVLNTILVEIAFELADQLWLNGRCFTVIGRKQYERRLHMADDLVREIGKDEWCEKMGIILNKNSSATGRSTGAAHM
ncbi:hypothetical protein AMS68_006203 [Peltaster fructicola]|uniref:Uncharacterized protein n=1 Tax=Peltaster fructicola TaxID=286661 RepID=A0A6H0Y171_9PEZI|nr:hypothetical protein AMS68_006203 [Peltaster fructicola]